MKFWNHLSLLSLSFLLACSTHQSEKHMAFKPSHRKVASVEELKSELSVANISKLTENIYHSYVLGQDLMEKFDEELDKNPSQAMQSETYSDLQAIRSMVDGYEDDLNESYTQLVLVKALPDYTQEQKAVAEESLGVISDFIDGATIDKSVMHENLEVIVLSNLREKQDYLYDELSSIGQDASITNDDPNATDAIKEHMGFLKKSKLKFKKKIAHFKADSKLVKKTLAKLQQVKSFIHFRAQVRKQSKEMRKANKALASRSTSSDSIVPSSGSAGNITGNSFPANTWSITFDDGPGSKTSPTVLQNLKDRNMKATFFMLAKQVEALPTTAKNIADAGMDIACHSYDHAQLTKVGASGLDKQITGAKKIVEAKLGKTVKLFRLPYGAGVSVPSIRAKIAENNMVHVFWNVDTLDWQDKNPESIMKRALKQVAATPRNNGVVLFHDIHAQSVIASAMLMDHFKKNKTNVCTVQAVVDQINKGLPSCEQ